MTTTVSPLNDLAAPLLANSRRWFPEIGRRGIDNEIIHMTLGIAGESGEVVEHVKKAGRYGDTAQHLDRAAVAHELADVITYILNLAALLDVDLDLALAQKQAICENRWGGGAA